MYRQEESLLKKTQFTPILMPRKLIPKYNQNEKPNVHLHYIP